MDKTLFHISVSYIEPQAYEKYKSMLLPPTKPTELSTRVSNVCQHWNQWNRILTQQALSESKQQISS